MPPQQSHGLLGGFGKVFNFRAHGDKATFMIVKT
jgi:hypothetical protein